MAQDPTPNAKNLNNDGRQSMLEGVFTEPVALDRVHRSILSNLDNDDNDSLRLTSGTTSACLGTLASVQGPPSTPPVLMHQADIIDRCEEFGLSVPPALGPNGKVSDLVLISTRHGC